MTAQETYFSRFKQPLAEVDLLRSMLSRMSTSAWRNVLGFDLINVAPTFLPSFSNLNNRFGAKCFFLKMPANSWYTWHSDKYRGAAINTVLIGNNSHTLFTSSENEIIRDEIVEVNYDNNTPVILNVQKTHAVLNMGPERVILSIGFNLPITYDEVLVYCKEQGLIE